MLAGTHIFDMGIDLPPPLMDRLLTAVERVLIEDGATHVWVDPSVSGRISVRAELPTAEGAEVLLNPPA